MADVAWFRELSNKDVNIAGGKGASLGEMFNAGLPIPPGFVVTAQAYQKFITKTGIGEKISALLKGLDVENNTMLQEAAKKVQNIILMTEMPEDIKNAILKSYEDLTFSEATKTGKAGIEKAKAGEAPFVAVRSSATAEDLPSISEDEHILVVADGKPVYAAMKEIYGQFGDGKHNLIKIPAMENNEIKWAQVGEIYRHKANDDKLYRIKTETGREVTVSKKHSLILLDKNSLEPKISSISELQEGDMVPAISSLPLINSGLASIDILDYIHGNDVNEHEGIIKIKNRSTNWGIQNGLKRMLPLTDNFAYFLGIYAAEGCTYKNNNVIITNSSEEVIERTKAFLKEAGITHSSRLNKGSLRIYCKALVRLLHAITGEPTSKRGKGRSCRIKQVPNFVFGCSPGFIANFLSGCFDGDGCIEKRGITYGSTSKMLVGGMIKLLELLNFKFYLHYKKSSDSYEIRLPIHECERFDNAIRLENAVKLKRLNSLVNSYKKQEHKSMQKESFHIPPLLSKKIREAFESKLPKEEITVAMCPACCTRLEPTSYYKGGKRYFCRNCHKAFYEDCVRKETRDAVINYDIRGRFNKHSVPWNKALIGGTYSIKKLKKLMKCHGLGDTAKFWETNVRWDKVKEVTPLPYDGWVYDFTVPNVENFAAGVGGIITHNTASFAGQQATFLNIKGPNSVVQAVQQCWASLYTARAIYYRVKNQFDHSKVFIAVVVQKMANSDKSGVMFSVNPVSQNEEEIMIEAGYGLGETVVSGSISPDQYVINKTNLEIKAVTPNRQSWMLVRDEATGENVKRTVALDKQGVQMLSTFEVMALAKLAKKIEEHYGKPQDLEYAIEGPNVYIVQSRPITTLKKAAVEKKKVDEVPGVAPEKANILVTGISASPGVGIGPVKIVHDVADLNKIEKGDVLVADMTNPDYVSAMEKAAAIVTDEGGSACHAAIVGREMGVPVIVGTEVATKHLKENQIVTVDATNGKVYEGKVNLGPEKKIEMAVGASAPMDTVTEVKVIMDLPEFAERAAATGADGVGLLRCEMMMAKHEHPAYLLSHGKKDVLFNELVESISKIASAFKGKPVWYRTSDFRTDEYRNLVGGQEEPHEDNPMLGWHGIRRSMSQIELLRTEFEAIKKIHEMGLTNVGVMLPMVTHVEQVERSRKLLQEVGLEPQENIDFGVMIETPASTQIIEEICKVGIDFISFGTNDLTQFTLAIDRNNAHVQNLYDEMHPAVLRQIKHVIEVCKEYGVETSICGQAGSRPEMAEFLVKTGIDSISANVDAVANIRLVVARAERKLMLKVAREQMSE